MTDEEAPPYPLEPAASAAPARRVCPCGAAAPEPLPCAGRRPVTCTACGTPLVRGGDAKGAFDRALGAALIAGSIGAAGWTLVVLSTGTGAWWVLPPLGAIVACAAWAGARRRGTAVQWASVLGLLGAVAAGEVLLYRVALLPRLVRLHEAEGARDAAANAQAELQDMTVGDYLHIELSLGLLLGLAVAVLIAWWLARAPRAVVAFEQPRDEPFTPTLRSPPSDAPDTPDPAPTSPSAAG